MLASPLTLFRRLPPAVRLLITGALVNRLGGFIVPYLAIVLRREFRLTASEVGLLLTCYGAGSLVSVLIGGVVADRLGRRLAMMASLFGGGALACLMGLSPSIRVFIPLLVIFGFVADLYRPAASSVIGDLLPPAQRAVGFAALRTAINLGFAVGMAVGGLLADWSWRAMFLADGVTTILYGAIIYFFVPETRPVPRAGPADGGPSPWRDPVCLQLALVSFAFALAFHTNVTALPLTITVTAGYPAPVYGCLVGLNGLLIVLFEIPATDALRRFRRLRVAAGGMLLVGVGYAVTGFVLHWAWFLFTVVLWTAGEILSTPQKLAFIADWSPAESRGRYLSLIQATWSLATAVNPILFLPLYARLGDRAFWPLLALVALPGCLLLLHLDRVADRPERLRGLAVA
jgi:predicted MFS family arabinose efflux permease